jgi:hypothetical protein
MEKQSINFELLLICVGITLLLPLLIPISIFFQMLMGQLVSVVWADLHPEINLLFQVSVVYGLSAAATATFMIKLRISKRLQSQYNSTRLWLVACVLVLVSFIVHVLATLGIVSLLAEDKQFLAYIALLAKVLLLIATVRMLIGILPRANKQQATQKK